MDHQNSELCMCVMSVFSVKFVGLFVILLIGLSTVAEFWQLLADLSVPLVGCFLQLYVIRDWTRYLLVKFLLKLLLLCLYRPSYGSPEALCF